MQTLKDPNQSAQSDQVLIDIFYSNQCFFRYTVTCKDGALFAHIP